MFKDKTPALAELIAWWEENNQQIFIQVVAYLYFVVLKRKILQVMRYQEAQVKVVLLPENRPLS